MKKQLYLLLLLLSTAVFAQQKQVVTSIDTIKNKMLNNKTLQAQKDTVKNTIRPSQMSKFNSILIYERLI